MRLLEFAQRLIQRKQPLSLSEYIPGGYRRLVTFTTLSQLRGTAEDLSPLEIHHSPYQYADWFCKVIQAAHPTQGERPSQEEIRAASEQPMRTFEVGICAARKIYQPYTESLVDSLDIPAKIRPVAINNIITLLHYIPLVSEKEARDLGKNPEALRREHWFDGPIIHPDWIEKHDNVAYIGGMIDTMQHYKKQFEHATKTGRII